MVESLRGLAEPASLVCWGGFIIGLLYGWLCETSRFCMRAAVAEWTSQRKKKEANRSAEYVTAMLASLLAVQLLILFAGIDFDESIYRSTDLRPLAFIVGGALFGIGMVLCGGCVSRLLILGASGNLRSLFSLIILGIAGYTTLRGILAYPRLSLESALEISGPAKTFDGLFGVSPLIAAVVVATPLLILLVFLLRRSSMSGVWPGLGVGALVAAGWWVSGVLGADDFEPQRLQSVTFVAPVGDGLQYLMTYTGSTISVGVATIAGVMLGAFLSSLLNGRFAIIGFQSEAAPLRYALGALLMGFGGVTALGCPMGQGITGTGTLAVGSFLTVISIAVSAGTTYMIMEKRA